jgi:hypothetical protein
MLTEDHLMRILRLAVAAIARIAGLKAAVLYEDALFVVDQTLEQVFGLRPDLIRRLSDENLLAAMTHQGQLDTDRLLVVADLIKAEAEIFEAMDKIPEARWDYVRALNFYLEVVANDGPEHFPVPSEQIAQVLLSLENQPLPPETLYGLFAYFEKALRYREAAAMLERLGQSPEGLDEIHLEQEAFFRRLLSLGPGQLEAGGLTRAEVERALAEVKG